MGEAEAKSGGAAGAGAGADNPQHLAPSPSAPQYGTFPGGGAPGYPQQPAMGFPQPAPPPAPRGNFGAVLHPYTSAHAYYPQGYQTVAGYGAIAEGQPVRLRRLPCCGIGIGWFLFILGFIFGAIPWYIGALMLLCSRVDYREKPGLIVCTIGAIITAIVVLFGVTKGADIWLI